jgi:hypothetical protein
MSQYGLLSGAALALFDEAARLWFTKLGAVATAIVNAAATIHIFFIPSPPFCCLRPPRDDGPDRFR